MKAITIWQPWASLIMAGFKPYEFRGWPAPKALVGQRIVIHAGSRRVVVREVDTLIAEIDEGQWIGLVGGKPLCDLLERCRHEPRTLPLAAGLGTAVLGTPRLACDLWPERFKADSDRVEHSNWAWPLADVQHFTPIVPTLGRQGFWQWPWSGAPQ